MFYEKPRQYHYPELANDIATLGAWEDAPFGDWGRAADVARGDYSKHQPNDRTMGKDWSLLPTPDEVGLCLAYNEMYDLMTPTRAGCHRTTT